jgi:hypothetical protein
MEKAVSIILAVPLLLLFSVIGVIIGAVVSCLVLISLCLLGLILVPVFLFLGLVFGVVISCAILS